MDEGNYMLEVLNFSAELKLCYIKKNIGDIFIENLKGFTIISLIVYRLKC